MKKETFRLDKSFYTPLSILTDLQLGQLFRAIYHHQLSLPVPEMDPAAKVAFLFITESMKSKPKRKSVTEPTAPVSGSITETMQPDIITSLAETEDLTEIAQPQTSPLPEVENITEPDAQPLTTPSTTGANSKLTVKITPDGRLKIRMKRHEKKQIHPGRKSKLKHKRSSAPQQEIQACLCHATGKNRQAQTPISSYLRKTRRKNRLLKISG